MLPRRSSNGADRPHTGPEDFNSGPQAAAKFRAALGHLAALPKSAVTNGHSKAKNRKKK